jgi:FkbM family methyltransferase
MASVISQLDQYYPVLDHNMQSEAKKKSILMRISAHYVDFIKDDKIIRISLRHFFYGNDIINSFNYYFNAVRPVKFNDFSLVDYSISKHHNVIGFDLMPVYFPSFSEPVVTTEQYMGFANLKPGDTVLDLGAYAGLTSILFKEKVGKYGAVVAVDADEQNIDAIRKNVDLYKKITGNGIDLLYGAVWNHTDGLTFSSEGNMGSSASSIVGQERGRQTHVKSFTLSKIAEITKIERIDFIKCDVEGAETVLFEDQQFFEKHRPRIIVEPHLVSGRLSSGKCASDLQTYGYKIVEIAQDGVSLPLLECYPM